MRSSSKLGTFKKYWQLAGSKLEKLWKWIFLLIIMGMVYVVFQANTNTTQYIYVGTADAATQQATPDKYFIAVVTEITEQGTEKVPDSPDQVYQIVTFKLLNGEDKGKEFQVRNDVTSAAPESQEVKIGEDIVVTEVEGQDQVSSYYIADKLRFPQVILATCIFIFISLMFGGLKGFMSLVGLGFSILVLALYVVPGIISGQDPLTISIIGTLLIASVSLYLAHGFSRRTTLSFISTLITIILATLMSIWFVQLTRLFGTGSEDALLLKIGPLETINLKGLLLGGIIFGTLGVLDDVTTAQTASVDEILKAKPNQTFAELYRRGLSVGKEHIASLINTLVLAYVGSSFPLLLLFTINKNVPIWLTLNSEFVVEEVVRTLVGSAALIFAVPISTILAAYFLTRWRQHGWNPEDSTSETHHHH